MYICVVSNRAIDVFVALDFYICGVKQRDLFYKWMFLLSFSYFS